MRRNGHRVGQEACWPLYANAMREKSPIAMQWLEMQQSVTAAIASAVQITTGHLTVLGNAVGGEFAADVALGEDGQAVVNQSPTSP